MVVFQSDLRSAIQIAVRSIYFFNPPRFDSRPDTPGFLRPPARFQGFSVSARVAADKPTVCTADELHYVSVHSSDWRLALWRYKPPPEAPKRNHPLLLLSGVGTNAIGFDLSTDSSFARNMSKQGFDTWILELRGAGLSMEETKPGEVKSVVKALPEQQHVDSAIELKQNEAGEDSAIAIQIRDLSQRFRSIVEEGQRSVSSRFVDLQDRFLSTIEDFQKQVELIVKYDWDFDHYLEEDVPAAMDYVRSQTQPKDGKLLAVGHSMGGILLYATLSREGFEGRNSRLAGVVTLASSLDYTTSKSSLKLLLPLADPAQALNVPVVPLGLLLAAAHPLVSRPPYVLSWLSAQISVQNTMNPELYEKLVLNNFGTVPSKLLLQLATAFREGGLRDRSGAFLYKEHLHKSKVPVLALAGDRDLICPPEAVYETVKVIPPNLVSYRVFGEPAGPHYAHYDIVGGPEAAGEVYPCIVDFLAHHDMT